jgi:hypothetical protein
MLQSVPTRVLATFALLSVLALAGCASGDDSEDRGSSADAPTAVGGREEGADELESAGGSRTAATAAATATVDLAQAKLPEAPGEIIYTADIDVRVRNVDTALQSATKAVQAAGGALFQQRSDLGRQPTIAVIYKVPPSRFDATLEQIGELGRVRNRQVDAADVTGRIVDLDARARATRTSVERLRTLLSESGGVGDLLTVERELATREAQLEALDGQLANLRARVDRATITANFSSAAPAAAAEPDEPTRLPGFLSGLRTGAKAFGNTAIVVGGAFGFALPFLAVAAVIAIPVFALRRRERHAGA